MKTLKKKKHKNKLFEEFSFADLWHKNKLLW